ncbi:hypothetical protein C2W62_54575 [Candidatus Entotheonella serta]|nr:hypothetical protein C2W62_54575 [Candidatus Entotheonella serta]
MPRGTPFVGREVAIKTLQQASEQVGAGHGQVVAITGETGVGKSRLMRELAPRYRAQGWRVLEMAAGLSGSAVPYLPLLTLIKHYSQIEAGDTPETIRAKVTEQIVNLDESLQETIPALLFLLDVLPENSPFWRLELPEQRHWVLDALLQFVRRESQAQPLLLMVEDLQRLDTETLTFLDRLVESLSTTQLLLWVTHQTTYQPSWSGKPYYSQVLLDPLPPESAASLLASLLGSTPDLDPLKAFLIERTAGHPVFLEESIRLLVETDILAGEPGAYQLTQAVPTIQLPSTLEAVLAARLDHLLPDDKTLLQTAAAIGVEVPLRLLQSVAEIPEERRYRSLSRLQAATFLEETSSDTKRICTFSHTLLHDVVYQSLTQEQQQALHQQIASAMEALDDASLPVEQVERLAYQAFQGECWDTAYQAYQRVGTWAERHAAYHEAMTYLKQALSAWRNLPHNRDMQEQGFELLCALQATVSHVVNTEQSMVYLDEAEALAKDLGDSYRLGRVSALHLHNLKWTSEPDHALEYGQRALTLLVPGKHDVLRATVNADLGQLYYMIGQYQQALQHCQHNLPIFEGARRYTMCGLTLGAVDARIWVALCMAELGTFAESISLGEEAIRLATDTNHFSSIAASQYNLGRIALRKGDISQAIDLLKDALTRCRVAKIPIWTLSLTSHLGLAYAFAGRVAEATPLIEEAVSLPGATSIGSTLGEAYLLTGHAKDALALATSTLEHRLTQNARGTQARILLLLGDICHHDMDFSQADAYYRQARTLAEELSMRPVQAHCHLSHGKLYRQIGQVANAYTELSTALHLYRTLDMTFWRPQAEAALAEIEGA